MSIEEVKELAKNSPFLLLILLVLWQYRRDYLKVIQTGTEQTKQFIVLLEKNIDALISNREATKENTAVIRQHFNDDQKLQRRRPNAD